MIHIHSSNSVKINITNKKEINLNLFLENLVQIQEGNNNKDRNILMKKIFKVNKLNRKSPRFISSVKKEKIFKIIKKSNLSQYNNEPDSIESRNSYNSFSFHLLNERKKKIEDVMVKIKRKIDLLVSRQNAIDIRDIKLYHKLSLEYKHNFYITPSTSIKNSADINKIEANQDEGNSKLNNPLKEKVTSSFLPPSMRIISPYTKEFICNCRRNQCRKNYCECRKNKEMCDPKKCSCEECSNQF